MNHQVTVLSGTPSPLASHTNPHPQSLWWILPSSVFAAIAPFTVLSHRRASLMSFYKEEESLAQPSENCMLQASGFLAGRDKEHSQDFFAGAGSFPFVRQERLGRAAIFGLWGPREAKKQSSCESQRTSGPGAHGSSLQVTAGLFGSPSTFSPKGDFPRRSLHFERRCYSPRKCPRESVPSRGPCVLVSPTESANFLS